MPLPRHQVLIQIVALHFLVAQTGPACPGAIIGRSGRSD